MLRRKLASFGLAGLLALSGVACASDSGEEATEEASEEVSEATEEASEDVSEATEEASEDMASESES